MSDLVMTTGRYNALPTYDGTRDVTRLSEYLRIIPTYFDKTDPTQQRNVLIRSLRGAAGNWLESCMRHEDWEKYTGDLLLAELKSKYYPQNQDERNASKLISLKQGSSTLSEYLRKFDEIGLNVTEATLPNNLRKYYLVYNLNEPLRSSDAFHSRDLRASISYLEDLCNREEPPSRKSLLPKTSFGPDSMEIDHLAPAEYPSDNDSPHQYSQIEMEEINAQSRAMAICFYCRKRGHMKRDCKKRRYDLRKTKTKDEEGSKN